MIAPILTHAGNSLLFRAINGEEITFTRFKLGNGDFTGVDTAALTDLINPILPVGISAEDRTIQDTLILSGEFTSSDIVSDFEWKELGLFAEGEDEEEVLFAYAASDDSGLLKTTRNGLTTENTIQMVLVIGNTENIVVKISESLVYASIEALNAHTGNQNNPHNVTKEQIGLGNVPNVSTNNQTPTYTEATQIQSLSSGEILRIAFGKISKAISVLIGHINSRNPHQLTANDIGAAKSNHTHNASDISAGVLNEQRGGTGTSNPTSAAMKYGTLYLKRGDIVRYSNDGADNIMNAGYYFIDSSNGGTANSPGASKYHLIVFGNGTTAVIQIAIVPTLYKTVQDGHTVYVRQIGIDTFQWSSWEAII